jgi:bacteriocin-like protein
MKLQELQHEELQHVNGGLLGLGDGQFGLSGLLEGGIGISHTDEDGKTESTQIGFGLGSMLGGIFN